jgi:hypothetical protein
MRYLDSKPIRAIFTGTDPLAIASPVPMDALPTPESKSAAQLVGPSTPAQQRLADAIQADRAMRDGLSQLYMTYNTPTTTIEFWGPQYHTLPSLREVREPFAIGDSIWELGPKILKNGDFDHDWWPHEFIRRDLGPLHGLTHQAAMFRRAAGSILLAAADWDSASLKLDRPTKTVLGLVASTGPTDFVMAADTASGGANLPLGIVLTKPSVIGLEMIVAGGVPGPARRARFGITPPLPLSQLSADTLLLSDMILYRPFEIPPDGITIAAVKDSMLRSLDLVDPNRIGVFWESYGVRDSDTTDVALRVVRFDDRGIVRRALSIFGVGASTAGSDSVTTSSRITNQRGAPAQVVGNVPLRSHTMTLNVSSLLPGRYLLELLVSRPGRPAAVTRREFTIARGAGGR